MMIAVFATNLTWLEINDSLQAISAVTDDQMAITQMWMIVLNTMCVKTEEHFITSVQKTCTTIHWNKYVTGSQRWNV